jgi:hypothetical protein
MHRLVGFADKCQLNLALLYYPPYHSKYNPVERCFGALENYRRGSVLDTVKAVVEMAKGMTWHQQHPTVELVTRVYEKGVKLTREAMNVVEARRPTTVNFAAFCAVPTKSIADVNGPVTPKSSAFCAGNRTWHDSKRGTKAGKGDRQNLAGPYQEVRSSGPLLTVSAKSGQARGRC